MKTEVAGTVLTVAGLEEFTAANAGEFRKQICAALDGHSVVEVDLSRTTTMDCAGLGALIAVRNLAHSRNGGVRLVGATSVVQRLFDVVRVGDLFEIVGVRAQVNSSSLCSPPVRLCDLSVLSDSESDQQPATTPVCSW